MRPNFFVQKLSSLTVHGRHDTPPRNSTRIALISFDIVISISVAFCLHDTHLTTFRNSSPLCSVVFYVDTMTLLQFSLNSHVLLMHPLNIELLAKFVGKPPRADDTP